MTIPATSAAIATTTRPIGFADSAAFSSHCPAAIAFDATAAAFSATVFATVATVVRIRVSSDVDSAAVVPATEAAVAFDAAEKPFCDAAAEFSDRDNAKFAAVKEIVPASCTPIPTAESRPATEFAACAALNVSRAPMAYGSTLPTVSA